MGKQETMVGSLTICVAESLLTYRVPTVLKEFRARFPLVHLIFRPKQSVNLERPLCESIIDLAIVIDPLFHAPNLIVESLRAEPMVQLSLWLCF